MAKEAKIVITVTEESDAVLDSNNETEKNISYEFKGISTEMAIVILESLVKGLKQQNSN